MHGTLIFATCCAWLELSTSDRLYVEALRCRGVDVRHAAWNDEVAPLMRAGANVLRSTWDCHHNLTAFRRWLGLLEVAAVPVLNPPALVRWNLDKRYLLEPQDAGIRIPRTLVAPSDPEDFGAMLNRKQWCEAVLKPAWGASGFAVERLRRADLGAGAEPWSTPSPRPMLLQEDLPEIAEDEISMVFLGGSYSHAVLKRPRAGEFHANSQYGVGVELTEVSDAIRDAGSRALEMLPEAPLYARVDGVLRDDELIVMEIKLHEPGPWLHLAPGSADRFVDATLERLEATA